MPEWFPFNSGGQAQDPGNSGFGTPPGDTQQDNMYGFPQPGNFGWPFGKMGALNVLAGTKNLSDYVPGFVVTQSNGLQVLMLDFSSIYIAAGATLRNDTIYNVVVLGCRGKFTLDGTIEGILNSDAGGTYILFEPNGAGKLKGKAIDLSTTQSAGGTAGVSGPGQQQNSGAFGGAGGAPGIGTFGNGGGSGGGGTGMGAAHTGDPGQNGQSTKGGDGGLSTWQNPPVGIGANVYSQNGTMGTHTGNAGDAASGSGGGSRGHHGSSWYIYASAGIKGTGTINVIGQNGGIGADGDNGSGAGGFPWNGCGGGAGGAGGGAGGSSGNLYIRSKNYSSLSITINQTVGIGGLGGNPGNNPGGYSFVPTTPTSGANGFNGISGSLTLKKLGHK